jgi:rubrerythrin
MIHILPCPFEREREQMAEYESDNEILEFAISREIEAFQFYTALAERMEKPQMRKVFEELAKEELEHKANLELEIIKTGQTVATGSQNLTADDYHIEGEFQFDMGMQQLLQMSIEKEKAAFKLYVDLAGKVDDENSRETLLALAEEEVKHKMRFEYEYDMLLKSGEFKKGQS